MTQASQSGGGRSTGNVNKNTDQLGGLADKATDQARNVAQHVEEFANNAAQQGREGGERIQEVAGNVKRAVDKLHQGSADGDFGYRRGRWLRAWRPVEVISQQL